MRSERGGSGGVRGRGGRSRGRSSTDLPPRRASSTIATARIQAQSPGQRKNQTKAVKGKSESMEKAESAVSPSDLPLAHFKRQTVEKKKKAKTLAPTVTATVPVTSPAKSAIAQYPFLKPKAQPLQTNETEKAVKQRKMSRSSDKSGPKPGASTVPLPIQPKAMSTTKTVSSTAGPESVLSICLCCLPPLCPVHKRPVGWESRPPEAPGPSAAPADPGPPPPPPPLHHHQTTPPMSAQVMGVPALFQGHVFLQPIVTGYNMGGSTTGQTNAASDFRPAYPPPPPPPSLPSSSPTPSSSAATPGPVSPKRPRLTSSTPSSTGPTKAKRPRRGAPKDHPPIHPTPPPLLESKPTTPHHQSPSPVQTKQKKGARLESLVSSLVSRISPSALPDDESPKLGPSQPLSLCIPADTPPASQSSTSATKPSTPALSSRKASPPLPKRNARRRPSNWIPEGTPKKKILYLTNTKPAVKRLCYESVKHKTEGERLMERDCVLVSSGDPDCPYVAKIARFFVNPSTGILTAGILWYYRAEQMEEGRAHWMAERELFTSRHFDTIPVDTIEDHCFVITANEYARFKGENLSDQCPVYELRKDDLLPKASNDYRRRHRQPAEDTVEDRVFFAKRLYDFPNKRFVKNPTAYTLTSSSH